MRFVMIFVNQLNEEKYFPHRNELSNLEMSVVFTGLLRRIQANNEWTGQHYSHVLIKHTCAHVKQ